MKKHCRFIICVILCFSLIGCSNGKSISPTSNLAQDLPSPTSGSNDEEVDSVEGDLFKNTNSIKDNKLSVEDGVQDLLQASDRKYTIEDKKYEQDGHKGIFNVSYPVLKSENKDMNVVNSVILARVVDELPFEDAETTTNIDLDYEIEQANDAFISILFFGLCDTYGAAHPNNITFTINFDLNHNRPLSLYDVITGEDNMLEKVHGAMESQLDKGTVEAFERLLVDELLEQIWDKYEGFYIKDERIYIRFFIPVGSYFGEYISFLID